MGWTPRRFTETHKALKRGTYAGTLPAWTKEARDRPVWGQRGLWTPRILLAGSKLRLLVSYKDTLSLWKREHDSDGRTKNLESESTALEDYSQFEGTFHTCLNFSTQSSGSLVHSPLLFKHEHMTQLFRIVHHHMLRVGADNLSLVLQVYRAKGTVHRKCYLRNCS